MSLKTKRVVKPAAEQGRFGRSVLPGGGYRRIQGDSSPGVFNVPSWFTSDALTAFAWDYLFTDVWMVHSLEDRQCLSLGQRADMSAAQCNKVNISL